jgi:2-oxoglutarate ferredoxin oxidoreductase subunit alpha
VKYRTPVIVLSDGYLANGAEPWRLPDFDALELIEPDFATEPNHIDEDGNPSFWPYMRDPETLARPWAPPGLPGLEHRIGGLEKADGSGNVSYEGINHERMVHLRRDKIAGIASDIPLLEVNDETGDAQLLMVSWGSTYAAVAAGVKRVRARGMKAAHAHLRYLNPFPANMAEVLGRYAQVMVPEINLGQLSRIIRSEFLVDAQSMSKMQGVPFRVGEIETAITVLLGGKS